MVESTRNDSDEHVHSANRHTPVTQPPLAPEAQNAISDESNFCNAVFETTINHPVDVVVVVDEIVPPQEPPRVGDGEGERVTDAETRKVRWNDIQGKVLVQIHEFEPSDTSDSEDDDGELQTCACVIQ